MAYQRGAGICFGEAETCQVSCFPNRRMWRLPLAVPKNRTETAKSAPGSVPALPGRQALAGKVLSSPALPPGSIYPRGSIDPLCVRLGASIRLERFSRCWPPCRAPRSDGCTARRTGTAPKEGDRPIRDPEKPKPPLAWSQSFLAAVSTGSTLPGSLHHPEISLDLRSLLRCREGSCLFLLILILPGFAAVKVHPSPAYPSNDSIIGLVMVSNLRKYLGFCGEVMSFPALN